MPKPFSLEIRIIVLTLLVLLSVVITSGVLAYRGLSDIVISAGKDPGEEKSLALKNILSGLSEAENSVHAYSLVKDSAFLAPFYDAVISIDEKLDELHHLYAADPGRHDELDSLDRLVADKYDILRRFLTLHNDQRIVESLQQFAQKMNVKASPVQQEKKSDRPEPVKEKSSIFQRIFGKNTRAGKDSLAQPPAPVWTENMVNVKEVQGVLQQVKEDQLRKLQAVEQEELKYTIESKKVGERISALTAKLEQEEAGARKLRLERSQEQLRSTNTEIALFCVVAALLLLAMSVVIGLYIRKNRAYSRALREAKAEAENLARAKENFLAVMSHEIRTPMNAITGFTAQLLQAPGLGEEQRQQLEIVKRSGDHLLKIINEVLDLSKLQAGKFSFHRSAFEPLKVLEEVMQLLAPVAGKKKIALRLETDPSLPPFLLGDELRLRQVLLNLGSNAVKFTEKGEVCISASAKARVGNEVLLLLRIKDTGIGIAKEKLGRIFNEFEQGDTDTSLKYGGTGLGLSITKKMVELQNGKIDVSSEEGKGTTVEVIIPYSITERTGVEQTAGPVNPEALRGRHVLVVDDEEYNRLLLAAIFKKWKVSFTAAASGEKALELLDHEKFDAVLMDIHLPGMDGVTATKKIREKSNSDIPVIALTASVMAADLEKSKAAGFHDFLSKPFSEADLFQKLEAVMNGKTNNLKPAHMKKEKKDEINGQRTVPGYSLEALKRLANNDTRFLGELLRTFISSTGEGVEQIEKYAALKDWEKVAHYTHKISAPCKHLSTNGLLAPLQRIETLAKTGKEHPSMENLVQELVKEKDILLGELQAELKNLE